MTSYVRYKPANIFFALVRLWAVRLSKNELDTIFSNSEHQRFYHHHPYRKKEQEYFSAAKMSTNSKNENSWRAHHQRAWPLMRPNFVRITCSQYKYALTLRGRNSRGARNPLSIKGLRRLWQVWRGRRFCCTDQPLLLTGHQGIGSQLPNCSRCDKSEAE